MSKLALSLRPEALETPTSFLSRLAARNGCPDMVSFCYDLGLDLVAISNGEGSSLEDLCHVADLPNDAFAKTAVIKTTKMGYRIGEETFESLTFNRGSVRVCPECLREQHRQLPELWGKVHQLHWQIPQIESCYLHNECLQAISEKPEPLQRFDTSFAIKNAWSYIRHLEQPKTADSFDHYLSKRLNRHRGQSLCDRLSVGKQLKLNNLLVSKEEVFQAFPQKVRNGFTKNELLKRWSIGLPALDQLIERGVLRQKRMKHSHSRVTGMLVLVEDVEAYEREQRIEDNQVFAAPVATNE